MIIPKENFLKSHFLLAGHEHGVGRRCWRWRRRIRERQQRGRLFLGFGHVALSAQVRLLDGDPTLADADERLEVVRRAAVPLQQVGVVCSVLTILFAVVFGYCDRVTHKHKCHITRLPFNRLQGGTSGRGALFVDIKLKVLPQYKLLIL